MDNTITSLKEKIEELKKRLKEISTSQSNYQALKQIKEYFAQVQDYLNTINQNYSSHITECSTHTTQIQDLQTQIDQLNTQINNLPTLEDVDLSQITNQIETLQTDLQTLQQDFTNLTQNSTTTIQQIESDLSTIQTELATLNDFMDQHQQEFTQINTTIGEMQTNITNLNTTQNNLTATQNTQATNISNINSRLSSVEQEVSAITGGIDLTELDERVGVIENGDSDVSYFSFKNYNYGITPSNYTIYTQEYYFSTNIDCTCQCFDLSYSSQKEGTLTVEVYNNKEVVKTFTVDLSLQPNNCRLFYEYIPTHKGQSMMLKLTASTQITYNSLTFSLYGKKVKIYSPFKDVTAYCLNNNIFITYKKGNTVFYDKFSNVADIDLENLTKSINLIGGDNRAEFYTSKIYFPNPTFSSNKLSSYHDCLYQEDIFNNIISKAIGNYENGNTAHDAVVPRYLSCPPALGISTSLRDFVVINGDVYYRPTISSNSPKALPSATSKFNGDWIYIFNVNNSKIVYGDSCLGYDSIPFVALYEDGYFYFFHSMIYKTNVRLGKGDYVTAYKQSTNNYNVYISHNNRVEKYNVYITNGDGSASKETIFNDCDCIYELIDNHIIKHIVSSDAWVVEEI